MQQTPFAVVLGCSDSRVPTEIIYAQQPGDLFVIRVAGNVVEAITLGKVLLCRVTVRLFDTLATLRLSLSQICELINDH